MSSPQIPETAPTVAPGSVLDVKRIDKIWNPDAREWTVEEHDDDLTAGSTANQDKYGDWREYAFIFRQKIRQSRGDDAPTISTTFLIRSQFLRDMLYEVMEEYLNINWNAAMLKIDFQALLVFLPHLVAKFASLHGVSTADASEEEQHLAFLIEFLQSEYSALLRKIQDLTTHGMHMITFDLLWAIFVPGDALLTSCEVTAEPRAFRLRRPAKLEKNYSGELTGWNLSCEYLEAADNSSSESAAEAFGLADKTLSIRYFEGVKKITDLSVYPSHNHPSIADIKEKLVRRGKAWTEFRGFHHIQYEGFAWRNGRKLRLDGRVIIDRDTCHRMKPDYDLPAADRTLRGSSFNRLGIENEPHECSGQLEDDLLLLATSILHGFSLTEKHWLALNVNYIAPIKWNDEPYAQLAIDANRKKLLQALVQSHGSPETAFDDFVVGKGRGLIINLFGPAGVGKTLTVEATSEYLRKPLYVVSAGDLGTSPEELDKALTKIFRLAPVWGAVVLLDEADVFLEKRSTADVERNAMVAVFLRQLEYYEGVLFLTTNRVKEFDSAFQSRIHLSLHYGDLSRAAKKQLWGAFLDKTRKSGKGLREFSAGQMEALSQMDFNGRQIKNIVKLSGALAAHERALLSYEHILTTLNATEEWDTRDTPN
ncbi:P-loop containing nucleoside triphosphate hydrolase protein [Mycena crocata]|nr:P-loop containing nucleoside triphosphate hydrolase protein [Mycena crocata]